MPTGTGRESAAERKSREAADAAADEQRAQAEEQDVTAKELATTGVVLRLRPQMITGNIEMGEAVHPDTGELVEIPLMVLDLAIAGAMINVEFPLGGAPRVASEMIALCQAYQDGEDGESKIATASPADVKAAAAKAKAAAQLRGDTHG